MTERLVTLTFDNGPTVGVTDVVLDELARRRIPAVFFVVGSSLEQPGASAIAERAVAAGHLVGNHSATHRIALGERDDPGAVDAEIDGCEVLLDELRSDPPLFRPFGNGGVIDDRLLGTHAVNRLCDGGYTAVLWNSVPHDWDDPDGWVTNAIADVSAREHTVIVLHDVPEAALPRLPEFLDRLADLDVRFTQTFPPSCVAIDSGRPTPVLASCSGRWVDGSLIRLDQSAES